MKTAAQPNALSAHQEMEFATLRELSARIGNNPLMVQASNGNTSIKFDENLWIKASGTWLAHAAHEEMFVSVNLADALRVVRNEIEIADLDCVAAGGVTPGYRNAESSRDELRPSIETPMHAVLRHRVVIHVHSINAIAWAIRFDGPKEVKERLAGLRWRWVPYAASGVPLARAIERAVADAPETDVLILGNHGLVVCGPDCEAAETLLGEVERRLTITPRQCPKPDSSMLKLIARFSRWQFPDFELLHALGTDAASRRILKGGVLYPCQAMFLGEEMPLLPASAVVLKFAERLNLYGRDKTPPFVAVEKSGVLLNRNMTSAERATLIALVQVTQRTEESTRLRYLKGAEVADVLNAGAYGGKKVVAGKAKSAAKTPAKINDKYAGERRIFYDRNAWAPWLGSQMRRLRSLTGSARTNSVQ